MTGTERVHGGTQAAVVGDRARRAVVVIAIAVLLFRWDWLIPFVDARASAALHRDVRIGHLHVALGRRTVVTAEDVRVADPAGFPPDDAFATARRLAITVDLWGFLHDRSVLRIPVIDVDAPRVTVATDKDGTPNYDRIPPVGTACLDF